MDDFRDKKITVMGLGLYGGGAAVARFLASHGARVTVTDLKTADELANSVASLDGYAVNLHLGGHDTADFERVDAVVANPAVPDDSEYLVRARESGAEILYETNLFMERCPAPVVGITGSNGKSTTATLIHRMLETAGRRAFLGGNVGRSLLEEVDRMTADDIVVLELSSFQLQHFHDIRTSPQVAVVTNISPNHLDRHGTMAHYIHAKRAILDYQTAQAPQTAAILNADDPVVRGWAAGCAGAVARFSLKQEYETGAFVRNGMLTIHAEGKDHTLLSPDELKIAGPFNVANVLAAALAAYRLGAKPKAIAQAARAFPGLEHRLERFAEWRGIRFVNDSKATTPLAAQLALDTIPGKIVLIAGGYDKQLPTEPFAESIARRCRAAIFIGDVADRMNEQTSRVGTKTRIGTVSHADSLEAAVAIAFSMLQPGDTLLLSPGFASWDQFPNFEARGHLFKTIVETLIKKTDA